MGQCLSLADMPPQALSLTFVYDEQDIPAPLNERMNDTTNHAVTSRPNTNSPNHYTSAIPHNVSHFPFQHITAFRADMTRRLETLEAYALNFDQRLNTIRQGIATLNERSTTADGPLNTIRQSLATADGHPINLNQRLNTIDESFIAVEGKSPPLAEALLHSTRDLPLDTGIGP
jgi:hypothetical protein